MPTLSSSVQTCAEHWTNLEIFWLHCSPLPDLCCWHFCITWHNILGSKHFLLFPLPNFFACVFLYIFSSCTQAPHHLVQVFALSLSHPEPPGQICLSGGSRALLFSSPRGFSCSCCQIFQKDTSIQLFWDKNSWTLPRCVFWISKLGILEHNPTVKTAPLVTQLWYFLIHNIFPLVIPWLQFVCGTKRKKENSCVKENSLIKS